MKGAILILIALTLASWCVALGGTAALTDQVRKSTDAETAAKAFKYLWWGVWFEFFLVLVAAVVALKGSKGAAPTLQAFFAALLSITMLNANEYLPGSGGSGTPEGDATAAGFVLLSICNFALIIVFGLWSTGTAVSVPTKSSSKSGPADEPTPAEKPDN